MGARSLSFLIVVGVIAVLSLGDAQGQAPKADPQKKQVRASGFEFTASYKGPPVAGHVFPVTFRLKNTGSKRARWLRHQNIWREFAVKVRDSKGELVARTRFARAVIGSPENSPLTKFYDVHIGTGDSVAATINVARLFDLTIAGEYTLSAWVAPDHGKEQVALAIKEFKFRVTEPAAGK